MKGIYLLAIGIIIISLIGGLYVTFTDTDKTNSMSDTTQSMPYEANNTNDADTPDAAATSSSVTAVMQTNLGDITLELDAAHAPNTVANFVNLARSGFYNEIKFHRVIAGFMIQAGDPLSKDDSMMQRWGTGGPGYTFPDEIHAENHNVVGTISMANAGPDTNGSQFFINVADNNFLDTKHTVFGRVVDGMDVVRAIAATETGPNDRPVSAVIITGVEVR